MLLAPSCRYKYQNNVIQGVDKIIQTYISNYESAQKQLDEIQFFSEVVGENDGQKFKLKYLDRIRKGDDWFEHRCEQIIQIEGAKVIEIEHRDLPGESERLKQWFTKMGIKR